MEDLNFICKICQRPATVPGEMMAEAAVEFAKLGMNPMIPTVCDRCDRELNTPRNQILHGEIRKLPPISLDALVDQYRGRKPKKPPLEIPQEFQDTEPEKLPCREAYEKAMKWQVGRRGLLLRGLSGTGKSRTLWSLMARLYSEDVKITVYDCGKLYNEIGEKFKNGWGHYHIKQLILTPILALDDLGQQSPTERGEASLFHIIKTRTEKKLPVIVSTQYTGDELIAKAVEGQRMTALVRRLRENTRAISFVKPKEEK